MMVISIERAGPMVLDASLPIHCRFTVSAKRWLAVHERTGWGV